MRAPQKSPYHTTGERYYLRNSTNIEAKITKMKAHIEGTPKNDTDKVHS